MGKVIFGMTVSLVDELHVDVMPALLGGGLRFLEGLETEKLPLERQ